MAYPKSVGSAWMLPVALGVGIILVLYWLYSKLFTPAARAEQHEQTQNMEAAKETMSNGRTYYSMAEEIYNQIYWNWWLFSFPWKNTDEAALGTLLKTVKREEFPKLQNVYLFLKKADGPDQNTLLEDLRKTFNEKEMRQYTSHLIDL